jgi:hypothetical protein
MTAPQRTSGTYDADEIRTFLRAVDRNLSATVRVVIIGGGAAALAYGLLSTTEDIDTYQSMSVDLAHASERAVEETGLAIPMADSAVADVPYHSEDRLLRQLPDLTNLEIWVLEKHDLALSKIFRGHEHDLDQLHELHLANALSFDILVQRFRDECTHVIGDPRRLRTQFLMLIRLLFGEGKRALAARQIPEPGE